MPEKILTARRPLIVIPARFSPHATALRYEAEVTARALVEAVFAAEGLEDRAADPELRRAALAFVEQIFAEQRSRES